MPADKIHFLPAANLLQRIRRLYHTLSPLRPAQYVYRLWYPLKKIYYRPPAVPLPALAAAGNHPQATIFSLPVFDCVDVASSTFRLLNISRQYAGRPDWNDTRHGMLWAYHLNYFGWLRDSTVPVQQQLDLLRHYAACPSVRIGLDSYPCSLRIMSWTRFFLQNGIREADLDRAMYRYADRLYHFPEYHLQGNHLWENACALLVAGSYFNDTRFIKKGGGILAKALEEQVLEDGAHIEGSPMYHSLLLCSLLQVLDVPGMAAAVGGALTAAMRDKAGLMLGWLEQVTFRNGDWPQVNDSTGGIAPSTAILQSFAARLHIGSRQVQPGASGYRMLRAGAYELFVDVGNIRPAWQPGHAHADTFSFVLHADGKPVIVDPGISTYEYGPTRQWQRSTDAHNTLRIGHCSSSDVWKVFRVGRKAAVRLQEDTPFAIAAEHNGYSDKGIIHRRSFKIHEKYIIINDTVEGLNNEAIILNLHFHPQIRVNKIGDSEFLAGNLRIEITGAKSSSVEPYDYAEAFNRIVPAQRLHVTVIAPVSIKIENITC